MSNALLLNSKQSKNINELLNILSNCQKNQDAELITMLLNQMQQMNENFNAVVKELNTVKEELRQHNTHQPVEKQSVIVDTIAEFENKVQDQYQQLESMKNKLSDKSASLVQNFKEVGTKALNKVCEFLGIKESLIKLKDMAQSNAVEMQNSIDKIEKIGFEVKSAATHMKNAGRAIAGKDLADSADTKQFKIFEKLKGFYQQKEEKFTNQVEKLDKAIEKFEGLERAADKVSVKEKLANNKAAIEARESSEPKPVKEKQQPEFAL